MEVLNASQKRIGGGLGGLGPDGTFVQATEEQMEASLKTLARLIACCRRTNTLFTMRSGGHCNAGCSSMAGTMTFGIKGLNIVAPKDFAKDFTARSLERPWESPGTVEVGAGADAGQAAYVTFNESFRHDPNHPKFRVANVPVGFAGGLPVGQKPTVGMAGLTLGGGFGFHTRYAGLLCDRLIALDAVNPDTAEIIHATKDNEHRYVTSQPFPLNPCNPRLTLDTPFSHSPHILQNTQRARVGCVRRRWRQLRGCHEVYVPDDAHLRRPKLHGHSAPALHAADAGAPLVLPRLESENGPEDHGQPGGFQLDYRDHRRHLDGFSLRIHCSPPLYRRRLPACACGGMRARSVRCRGGSEQQCEGSPEACLFSFHFASQERGITTTGAPRWARLLHMLAATGVSGCNRRFVGDNNKPRHRHALGLHGSRDISYRSPRWIVLLQPPSASRHVARRPSSVLLLDAGLHAATAVLSGRAGPA